MTKGKLRLLSGRCTVGIGKTKRIVSRRIKTIENDVDTQGVKVEELYEHSEWLDEAPLGIAALETEVDLKQPLSTVLSSVAETPVTSEALTFLSASTKQAQRASLQLGTAAVTDSSAYAPAGHTHASSDITSGTLADARVSASSVTQHQGLLSIASSQVTGTKTSSYISDFTEAAQDAVGGSLSPEFVYTDVSNTIALRPISVTYLTPTLNSVAMLSSTRNALVSYAIDISATVTVGSGNQVGTVFLEVANDLGFTSGVTEISRFVNGNATTPVTGITITQIITATLTGVIPAGKYRRLRTENTTGTPVFTSRPGQEVLL